MVTETKYPQCPNGHTFVSEANAIEIKPMGTRSLQLIAGWILIYCTQCGHIFQLSAPAK